MSYAFRIVNVFARERRSPATRCACSRTAKD